MKIIRQIPMLAFLAVAAKAEEAAADYEIHEWGTFTTMHDSRGAAQPWYTTIPVKELPEFVYQQDRSGRVIRADKMAFSKTAFPGNFYVRMETPVVYFHSSAKRSVSLMARYFNGVVSEWYPRASEASNDPTDAYVLWDNIELDPSIKESSFPAATKQGEHYFAARRTSATPLTVPAPASGQISRTETEKFLFYRGAFNTQPPVTITQKDNAGLQLQSQADLPDGFVIEAKSDGSLAWHRTGVLAPNTKMDLEWPEKFIPSGKARPELEEQLTAALTAAGLFPDEAKAMVDTWKNDWLGEKGKRLLCILPQSWLDQTIALSATPKPKSIKRVFVSRMEYFDADIEAQVADIITSASRDHAGSMVELRKMKLGRFQPQLINIAVQRLSAKTALLAASLAEGEKPLSSR